MSNDAPTANAAVPGRRLLTLLNALGRVLRLLGVQRDLEWRALRQTAERDTGLDDWGDDPLQELLSTLVHSLESDGRLTPIGRLVARRGLRHVLGTRLYIQRALREQPHCAERPIRRPLFVAGLPRTGTTFLHNLLAQDPVSRPLLTWETAFPAPIHRPGDHGPDRRAEIVRQGLARLKRFVPQMATAHAVHADQPEECSLLLGYAGILPLMAETVFWEYRRRLDQLTDAELITAYQYHRLQLQILQGDAPPGHWVLKATTHVYGLFGLLSVYPDACVVQTHRDPQQIVASSASLVSMFLWQITPARPDFGEALATLLADRIRRGLAARAAFPPERVLDVRYADLVRAPIDTVRRIYDHFGYEYTPDFERLMQLWLYANPQHKHGVHRYSLEQFGLTPQRIDELFADYIRQCLSA